MPRFVVIAGVVAFGLFLLSLLFFLGERWVSVVRDLWQQEMPVRVQVGSVSVLAQVADTREEWRQGLANTTSLGEREGMLFVFQEEGFHRIWMRDMEYPLDLIFIDNNLTVIDIVENVQPDSYPNTFTSSEPARFVLEVNAFFAEAFDVSVGDEVQMPLRYLPADIRQGFLD